MKTSAVSLAVMVGMIAGTLPADDKSGAATDLAALEEMMMEMAKVGPQHEYFKQMVGEWTTKSTDFTSHDEPTVTEGTASFELLMGGRYLKQTFQGEFNGMKFEGMGLTAYDNAQQKYTGTWIDNFSTGMMHFEGKRDEATGVMTDIGQVVTPAGPMKFKMVTEHPADGRMLFTMYMLGPDGSQTKHMTTEYTRQ